MPGVGTRPSSTRRPHVGQQRVVAVLYLATMFVTIMDSTIVNVALPSLGRSFNVPTTSARGVIVGYLVAMAIAMPVSSWLGNKVGNERLFLSAIAIFTGTSALCAVAPGLTALVLFRCLQGAGAGLMLPVGLTMLYRIVPEGDRLRVNRLLMIPLAIAPASAPVIGGFLVQQLSWHWVFWVNVPICALALATGLWLLKPTARHPVGSFDVPGFIYVAIGMASTMYALNEGPDHGWGSATIWLPAAIGVAGLLAFIRRQSRAAAPILDLRVLKRSPTRNAMLVSASASISFSVVLYAGPLMLQDARGYTPLHSGLTTFAEAVGVAIGTQIFSRLLRRLGARCVVGVGLTISSLGATLLATLSAHAPSMEIWLWIFIVGFGMAGEMVPTQLVAFEGLNTAQTGAASAIYNVAGRLCGALGVALASAVIVALASPDQSVAALTPYRWAFVLAAIASAAGVVAAARLPGADPVKASRDMAAFSD